MSDNKPLVSIVIPVYNGGNYLEEAINSALDQTYENCEILVINDGSTDGGVTEKIAKSYGDKIRYFYKENGGVSSALNLGISKMRGEYFSWLSHDDVYYEDKIEKQVNAAIGCGDRTRTVMCEYDYWHMKTDTYDSTQYTKIFPKERIENSFFIVWMVLVHMCCALIHRSQIERVGKFNENLFFTQDTDFAFRLLRGNKIEWVDKQLYKVRIHDESDTYKKRTAFDKEANRFYMEMFEKVDEKELESVFGKASIGVCRIASLLLSHGKTSNFYNCDDMLKKLIDKEKQGDVSKKEEQVYDKKYVIYGAGKYGVRLAYEFYHRNLEVKFFVDADSDKWGKKINGIACVSMDDLKEQSEAYTIIVSIRASKELLIQRLKEHGFTDVIGQEEAERLLVSVYPTIK